MIREIELTISDSEVRKKILASSLNVVEQSNHLLMLTIDSEVADDQVKLAELLSKSKMVTFRCLRMNGVGIETIMDFVKGEITETTNTPYIKGD